MAFKVSVNCINQLLLPWLVALCDFTYQDTSYIHIIYIIYTLIHYILLYMIRFDSISCDGYAEKSCDVIVRKCAIVTLSSDDMYVHEYIVQCIVQCCFAMRASWLAACHVPAQGWWCNCMPPTWIRFFHFLVATAVTPLPRDRVLYVCMYA